VRATLPLLALLLAVPLAQSAVSVEDVGVPERTLAGKAFEARLTLANDGPAREVTLFAALYRHEEGEGPCGPATDARFRTFTHVVQERVALPANAVVEHPPPGARWLQMYEREDVPRGPTLDEFCVFVAESGAGPTIEYEAFGTSRLNVRGENAAPLADFSWEPRTPRATEDAAFRASGSDAEGDPVSYHWDFGHANASGRAVGEGPQISHFFYPEGEYVVTLTASDGLNETRVTRTVTVLAADAGAPEGRGLPIPSPTALIVVALALGRVLRRR
jgi:hypothetical protein